MDLWRFHLPDLRAQLARGRLIAIPGEQAHHALSVLRLKAGDEVILFDGAGAWVTATPHGGGGKEMMVRTGGELHDDPPPALQLTLATAVPKGDRAEWLIEQASQLNVAAVQWLDCDRSVVKPREGGGKLDKWRRIAVESARQCGRTHLLRIHEPRKLPQVLSEAAGGKILWLDPGAGGEGISAALAGVSRGKITALVGPEGGWSDAERALLEAPGNTSITRVRLTETVLRIETACAAVAAVAMSR